MKRVEEACLNPRPSAGEKLAAMIRSEEERSGQRVLAQPPVAELEARLIAAWRGSGLRLGKLVVLAADAYAVGAAVSLTGICDEALVLMCERYVLEHGGQK